MSRAVRVLDRGFNKAIANAELLARKKVVVGIQSGAGQENGVDLLDILIFNEFGTRRIPARPVMRSYYDTYAAQIGAESDRATLFILRTGAVDAGLSRLGAYLQSGLQSHWRASKTWAVPNSAYTIKNKGSDVPLIDNGVLINAVRWAIR
jgi:hypothetical protein